jgi:hypothetical protein
MKKIMEGKKYLGPIKKVSEILLPKDNANIPRANKISPISKSFKFFLNRFIKNIVSIPKKLINSKKREGKSDLREIFGMRKGNGFEKKYTVFAFIISSISALWLSQFGNKNNENSNNQKIKNNSLRSN